MHHKYDNSMGVTCIIIILLLLWTAEHIMMVASLLEILHMYVYECTPLLYIKSVLLLLAVDACTSTFLHTYSSGMTM